MELEKYKLKPRARGVWWHWGTKDEVLERKPGITTLPGGPKPPLVLPSEDEVVSRLEEQTSIWV